jgi:NADPH:quinone reductase-like Zn-dependent oxidoreductase
MRAVVVRGYGGPEALEVADVPVPEPRRGQVRIRVEAAARAHERLQAGGVRGRLVLVP